VGERTCALALVLGELVFARMGELVVRVVALWAWGLFLGLEALGMGDFGEF
jgi:hypothetical protein